MRKYLLIAISLVAMIGSVTVLVEYATVDESGYGAIMRFFGYGAPPERVVPETLQERGLRLMDRLVEVHGWTPEGSAIAAGQAQVESNLTPDGPPADNGRSHGLFMWKDDRFENLKTFAKERGQDYRDFDVQIDFFDDEVTHRSGTELGWKNVADLDNAALIGHLFEVYGSATTRARVDDAKTWLKTYREQHDSKTSKTPPSEQWSGPAPHDDGNRSASSASAMDQGTPPARSRLRASDTSSSRAHRRP
jgi:hypothetical protein